MVASSSAASIPTSERFILDRFRVTPLSVDWMRASEMCQELSEVGGNEAPLCECGERRAERSMSSEGMLSDFGNLTSKGREKEGTKRS